MTALVPGGLNMDGAQACSEVGRLLKRGDRIMSGEISLTPAPRG